MVSGVFEVESERQSGGFGGAKDGGFGSADLGGVGDGGSNNTELAFDVTRVEGIGEYTEKVEKKRVLYQKGERVFLVVNANTIEVRTDAKLGALLREKYESVMESRYFGRGGIEVVLAGQLSEAELEDLVRLSYNLT